MFKKFQIENKKQNKTKQNKTKQKNKNNKTKTKTNNNKTKTSYFLIFWVGRKRANKHLFSNRPKFPQKRQYNTKKLFAKLDWVKSESTITPMFEGKITPMFDGKMAQRADSPF